MCGCNVKDFSMGVECGWFLNGSRGVGLCVSLGCEFLGVIRVWVCGF